MPVYQHLSAVWRDQTNDHIKGCGLPGTVGTEQTHYFALTDVEGYAVYYSAATIGLANIVGRQCLHLLIYLSRTCRVGLIGTYEHPIIATKESQRIAGHGTLFGIKNARQFSRPACQDEL